MPTFNLVDEPFIPCVRLDGSRAACGLRDVLLNAHEIAEVRDESPLVTVALHRLLLAVLHRAYGGPRSPRDRGSVRAPGQFDPGRVGGYLARWGDRFDLFSEAHPFYQVAGFKTAEPSGINRLAQERSRGNNAALFDHTTDDPPPAVTPAAAARLLVAEQAFAVGGGKSDTGNTTHAPLVSAAAVLAVGATLFETLWLNLLVYDGDQRPVAVADDAEDLPVWERAPIEPHRESARPRGYLDFLTWQSRTLRLHPEVENGAVLVRRVSYAQGRRCEPEGECFNPMAGYARKSDPDPWQPVRFNEYRDLWRDSTALYQVRDAKKLERAPLTLRELAGGGVRDLLTPGARYKLSVFGLCTDKAKVNFWRHESLPLPLAYLDDDELVEQLKLALRLAEEVAAGALRKAAWVTAAARLTGNTGTSPDTDRVRNLVESFAPERVYWSRLEVPYRELLVALAGSSAGRPGLLGAWFHETLCGAARSAFRTTIGRVEGGRNYKAAAVGERVLDSLLAKVQRAEQVPNRNSKDGAA